MTRMFPHRPEPVSAAQLGTRVLLSPAASRLIAPNLNGREFFKLLIEKSLFVDAIRVMAVGMPPRDAIWWGCLCARHTLPDDAEQERDALRAAVRWVLAPTVAHQQEAAKLAGDTPGELLARAAGMGGNSSDPKEPPVPKRRDAPGRLVGAAVFRAAARRGGEAKVGYRQFLAMGIEVFRQSDHWATRPGEPYA